VAKLSGSPFPVFLPWPIGKNPKTGTGLGPWDFDAGFLYVKTKIPTVTQKARALLFHGEKKY